MPRLKREARQRASQANFSVAHLTGTARFTLNDGQRQELRQFVEAGGTLVIDAAAGSQDFEESSRLLLDQMFGAASNQLDRPLQSDHPVYLTAAAPAAALDNSDEPLFRTFARRLLGSRRQAPPPDDRNWRPCRGFLQPRGPERRAGRRAGGRHRRL